MEKRQLIDLIQKLRPQIDAALQDVAKRNGLAKLAAGNVSYSTGGSFVFKLEGLVAGGMSAEQQLYAENCGWMKLPPLGTEMTINGVRYKTDGLNRGSKVIMLRLDDGKRYLFAESAIQRGAEKQGLIAKAQAAA